MKNFSALVLLFTLPLFSMSQSKNEAIDQLFKSYSAKNPGASVAIIQNHQMVFYKAYGMANRASEMPVQQNTNFRLASVSKQFTAAAILQLIQAGKLNLKNTLQSCFPELPAYAAEMNIQQLLNHTSGILDYDADIDESENAKQVSDKDVLEHCKSFTSTYFKPGTAYRYSNTAYVLLGLIIEKYSGQSYSDYLEQHIFKPLNMQHTVAYVKGKNELSHRAYGYTKSNGQWVLKDQSSTSATLGDGGIYSSVTDLVLWDKALYDNQILPQAIWQEAFSPQQLTDGSNINYGYGWHLKDFEKLKAVYHTGSTSSFRNVFFRIPQTKISIIILTNRNKPEEENMVNLAEAVYHAYFK